MPLEPRELKAFARTTKEPLDQPQGPEPTELEGTGAMEEGGQGRFGKLIVLLEDAAIELQDAAEDLSDEALDTDQSFDDIEPKDQDVVEDTFEGLGDEVRDAMVEAFKGGITEDEAHELAEHLSDEDMIDEQYEDHVGALLYWISEYLASVE